jgi:hypothetical protein
LELLKKQREVMEEDIRKRKKEIDIRNMEDQIALNKKQNQRIELKPKVKDSLE